MEGGILFFFIFICRLWFWFVGRKFKWRCLGGSWEYGFDILERRYTIGVDLEVFCIKVIVSVFIVNDIIEYKIFFRKEKSSLRIEFLLRFMCSSVEGRRIRKVDRIFSEELNKCIRNKKEGF